VRQKISITVNESLIKILKSEAEKQNISLSRLIENALKEHYGKGEVRGK